MGKKASRTSIDATRLRVLAASILGVLCSTSNFAQTAPNPTEKPENLPTAQPTKPEEKPATVEKIEVSGKNDAVDQRRNSTAAKIIITREDIQQYGDSNIADVMRRLPGVTQSGRPGRGGPVAMRGMGGGFTQILIDGQRIPPGFSLDQLTPEQVERIEILRAPTAETGARAVAGTINIILREPLRKTDNDLQLEVTEDNGVFPARASYTHNDKFGDKGTWTLTANGGLGLRRDESATRTEYFSASSGTLLTQQLSTNESDNLTKSLFVNARAQWQLGPGEQFGVMAFAGTNQPSNTWHTTLNQPVGVRPAQFAIRDGAFEGNFSPSRINVNLNKRWDPETRYELRAGVGLFRGSAHLRTVDTLADGAPGLISTTDTSTRDQSWNLSGKLTRNFAAGKHSVTAGGEIENVDRTQTSVTLNDGVQQLTDLGEAFIASTQRFAIYAQDEWEIAEQWSANIGARYETIRTTSVDNENDVNNTSRVFTPLGHLVWRFAAPRKDQIRLSLTQSYRSPNVDQLLARPWLNTTFAVPGPNTFVTPDRAGNPSLRPERANGIDLAYERFFGSGGIFSVNLFHRQIKDLIRNVTALESVSWASSQRYVNRPQNFSEAYSQGIEFDSKFSLPEMIAGAPPINVRLNASVFNSKVKDVIGPNNRISEQPKAIGNVGGDYRFRNTPLSVGGTVAWTPGYILQSTNATTQVFNLKRVVDAYALWTINPQTKVRLTASNITPNDTVTENITVTEAERVQSETVAKNYRTVTLKLELKF